MKKTIFALIASFAILLGFANAQTDSYVKYDLTVNKGTEYITPDSLARRYKIIAFSDSSEALRLINSLKDDQPYGTTGALLSPGTNYFFYTSGLETKLYTLTWDNLGTTEPRWRIANLQIANVGVGWNSYVFSKYCGNCPRIVLPKIERILILEMK